MASISSLVTSLPKFGHAGAAIARTRAWNARIFAAATPRPIQVPSSNDNDGSKLSSDGIKGASGETMNMPADQNQDKANYSTGPRDTQVKQKARELGGEIKASSENIGERAKQAMQDAWDSTKNTAHRATDSVLEKAGETVDSLKQSLNNNKDNTKN